LKLETVSLRSIRAILPNGSQISAELLNLDHESLSVLVGNEVIKAKYFLEIDKISIWAGDSRFNLNIKLMDYDSLLSQPASDISHGRVITTMPCKINEVLVKSGDLVTVGSPLCVTEAMKMEVN
jgi:acetyl/propionyl-CoA carboxylase alpha subunit